MANERVYQVAKYTLFTLLAFLLYLMLFNKIRLERVRLDIENFRELDKDIKLIQLTDLHISQFGRHEKKLIELVNGEKADIIFITGDLIMHYQNEFSACIETLQELRARHGVFAVLGNSEHMIRPIERFHAFLDALEDINVNVLINQSTVLNLNGTNLHIVGVDDPFLLFDRFDQAAASVPPKAPMILLAHSPDVLLPRADALVINLLDSNLRKDHHKKWGWENSTYFGPENGNVYLQNDGMHTLRVQTRQAGVYIDTILLSPYEEIDGLLESGYFKEVDELLTSPTALYKYRDLIVISAADVDVRRIHGKWKKAHDSDALFNFRLDDFPTGKRWQLQPLIIPKNYFEADFEASKGKPYHVWIRMRAITGSPMKDSVYLQFSDSVDIHGNERYLIGKPAYGRDKVHEADLILAGHTHGGQIRIPFYGPLFTMTSMDKKYCAGLHRFGKSLLYVSRGIGTSLLPARLFCPPEITVFTFQ